MAASDARPNPLKGVAYRMTFVIRDANGDPVSGAADLDSEISRDGTNFIDCVYEATEIQNSGVYYLDLTAGEMNADTVVVRVLTSTAGAKQHIAIMQPGRLVIDWSGDSAATLALKSVDVNNPDGIGIRVRSTGQSAIQCEALTTGSGLTVSSQSGDAIYAVTSGTGAALKLNGGANGFGFATAGQIGLLIDGNYYGALLTSLANGYGLYINKGITLDAVQGRDVITIAPSGARGVYVIGDGAYPGVVIQGGAAGANGIQFIGTGGEAGARAIGGAASSEDWKGRPLDAIGALASGAMSVTISSAVADGGELRLIAGDARAGGDAVVFTIHNYSGASLDGKTATLTLMTTSDWHKPLGQGTVALSKTTTVVQSGTTLTMSFTLATADTANLSTSPPDQRYNYHWAVSIAVDSTERVKRIHGPCTIIRPAEA